MATNCHRKLLPHRFDIRAVQQVSVYQQDTNRPIRQFTSVLRVCRRCSKVRTERVDGHWTLEDIQGAMAGRWSTS